MKKLIVKSALQDVPALEEQLALIDMKFSPEVWQHERIYVPRDFQPGQNMPRLMLRTEVVAPNQPANYYLLLKRHIEDSGVDWINVTPVGNYTETSGMIHQLGFRKMAEMSRQRRALWIDKQTVLYLDKIEGLDGHYLKLEAEIGEQEAVEAVWRDLLNMLMMLGQESFTMQTYAELLSGANA